MFKIVKTSTLAALRQQLDDARRDAQMAWLAADAARQDAQRARTDLQTITDDRVAGLAALREAVRDPRRRPSALGLIATRLLRDQIEHARATAIENGGEIDPKVRFLDALFGELEDDGTLPVQDTAEIDHSPASANA